MPRLSLHEIGRPLSEILSQEESVLNRTRNARLDEELNQLKEHGRDGWGEAYRDRVHEKNKLTTWERIERLIDEGTRFFEFGSLVNHGVEFRGTKRPTTGAGVVTGLGMIQDRWCVVIGNDNTVASGAWWPKTPEKIQRAQDVGQRLCLPVLYLVDCSGLFLPEQANSFPGRHGAGHIFTKNARLSAAGVPQIAGVFGDCIAGGGYMPIISDRVFMTEGAYMVIAGAALIRGAKAQNLTSIDIGGADVHVHQSGCADVRVPDDQGALLAMRAEVEKLPSSGKEFFMHGAASMPPKYDPKELNECFPADFRHGYDVHEVIARLVDGSLFHEVLPGVGLEVVTGLARIGGLWVGIAANRQGIYEEPGKGRRVGGVLYREGISKLTTFVRGCESDGIPMIWLQDISGFDIGVEAERQGLLGFGSNLIYANANRTVPFFVVLLRKASGAGYYAMSGMPFEPVLQLGTPQTRLAVMEGRTLAIAAFNSKLDENFEIETKDPDERKEIEEGMKATAARIEGDMDPVHAASRMDLDELVPLGELRDWLQCLTESAWQSLGGRPIKNPRIWSFHDLEVLCPNPAIRGNDALAGLDGDGDLVAPVVGQWTPGVEKAGVVTPGGHLGQITQNDVSIKVVTPARCQGRIVTVREAGWVQAGDLICSYSTEPGVNVEIESSQEHGESRSGLIPVCSETEGTFYRQSGPDTPPFAAQGSVVKPQSTIGLVEVMKTFSPIRAGIDGILVSFEVSDGDAVQAGQTIAYVEAAGE